MGKSQSVSYWHKLFYTNFREALTTNLEAMAMANKGLGLLRSVGAGAAGAAGNCAAISMKYVSS